MTSELGRRIALTLGAFLVCRIGSYIPLPNIDPPVWTGPGGVSGSGMVGPISSGSGDFSGRLVVVTLAGVLAIAILGALRSVMFASPVLRSFRKSRFRLWYVPCRTSTPGHGVRLP